MMNDCSLNIIHQSIKSVCSLPRDEVNLQRRLIAYDPNNELNLHRVICAGVALSFPTICIAMLQTRVTTCDDGFEFF